MDPVKLGSDVVTAKIHFRGLIRIDISFGGLMLQVKMHSFTTK